MEIDISHLAAIAISAVVTWMVKPYFTQKAQNLATKADIGEITNAQHTIIEKLRAETDLRFVVAPERFKAHQEAHTLWNKVLANVHDGVNLSGAIREGFEWWLKNSLYLDERPRAAFRDAIMAAHRHKSILEANQTSNTESSNAEVQKKLGGINGG